MPTPNVYMVDTNIVIGFFNGDPDIRRRINGVVLIISTVVAGELYNGAMKSDNRAENIRRVREYLTANPPAICNHVTAERYGIFASELSRVGITIPENDIWIAAHAYQHNLPLVTRDQHFNALIPHGLRLERW